jgi:hypothetical protein
VPAWKRASRSARWSTARPCSSASGTTPRYTSSVRRRLSRTSRRSSQPAATRSQVDEGKAHGLLALPDAVGGERQDRHVRLVERDRFARMPPFEPGSQLRPLLVDAEVGHAGQSRMRRRSGGTW